MRKFKMIFALTAIVAVGTGLLLCREEVTQTVGNGLSVCGEILIPSLFPFMVLSSFALASGVFTKMGRRFSFVMNKLFRLPGVCFSAVFFGFIGGYPVGARIIAELYESGYITQEQSRRLFAFCVNAGPAFIVTAAGGMMIGSQKAGYVMLASTVFSSVIVGIIYSRFSQNEIHEPGSSLTGFPGFSDALTSSVVSSTSGMLSVCAWVLVFSALSGLIRPLIHNETIDLIFDALSEVTSGVPAAVQTGGIPFAAAAISFGGICVMCQLIPSMRKCGIKLYEHIIFRIINGALSYLITWTILQFVDVPVSAGAFHAVTLWSYSAPSAAALLMMCAVLILEMSDKRYAAKNKFSKST